MKQSSVNILTPHETEISLVFSLQWNLLGIVPFHPKYSAKVTHPFEKCRFGQISAYNVLTVRDSDKNVNDDE